VTSNNISSFNYEVNHFLKKYFQKININLFPASYHNANSFSRMFKRITGITPGEYRLDKRLELEHSIQKSI